MRNTAKRHHSYHPVWRFFLTFTLFPVLATSIDLITPTQFLAKDQTLVSAGQQFELGFFPSGKSNNWYIGIWYKSVENRTIVWVANRDSPLANSSGILKINADDGNLLLVDEAGKSVWSTNHSRPKNTVAELLDNGNFVLRQENDEDPENYLWQSFHYPTDTMLPGMKLGWDSKTGLNRYITSWKTADDPSTGDYSFKLNISGFPELYLMHKQVIDYRSGAWNGLRFSGVPEMNPSPLFSFLFVMNPNHEVYYSYFSNNDSVCSRLVVTHTGSLQRFTWIPTSKIWNLFWYAPKDQCDDYKECGVYGLCDTNASPVCKCLKGFKPRNPAAWNLRDGSDGCFREHKLSCKSDGFWMLKNVKLPESGTAFVDKELNLSQCQELCRKNCSCRGYSNANITGGGTGCVIWAEDLYDMRQYAVAEGGQDFYLRVSADDLEQAGAVGKSGDDSKKTKQIIMVAGIIVGAGVLALAIFFVWKSQKSKTAQGNIIVHRGPRERSQDLLVNVPAILSKRDNSGENVADELDLPLFDMASLMIATNKFSDENKLGQGGFGSVYKGVLEGQEIAVKRLSKNSGQGLEEFKNEVKLIARLQHINLVRLLGCCIEMEEKMLIYEYMENKSLDSILFKKDKSSMLDWQKRFNIICGIARGLLYLHQDSRFRIIHRDLKASNILLDKEMNPKISDFGMARIFGRDQTEANTRRVVGTYGYMSPEYAMDGLFSVKSDVFSFGVLVLEVVSGMKNRGFYQTNNQLNLLAYAWKLYREGRALEVMDPAIGESYSASEVMRCIQVGLLCVQEHAEDRPNMSTVVLMLNSDFVSMPQPKNPGYCLGRRAVETDSSSSKQDESGTVNQVTVTILDGR
ncbi:Serine/threonine protein kinase [Handroanthus impetiginosus]|uniref:Receptor-like serine/threonine-protein kinase n=1 Tax=Handroanthus impetiginosus TaxID=429701 RepID=A0A2G9GFB5_9LAMI|nr:Serine/threonine protein kinase [Handroanthus impetiginosus]